MPLKTTLLKYWGYSKFRPMQEEIIQSVLDGNDTLALLPTGGGKSICFQVPALIKPGICVVISPLIALMKDQVENLEKKGIKAKAIYSGMPLREIEMILNNAVYGNTKLLYVSPERLQTEMFKEHLKKMNVNLIAVDEAHCISQWGYDFRPPYLQIKEIRQFLPEVPVLALTATATPDVVEDIQLQLCFKKKNLFQKSFERKNLTYFVLNKEDKLSYLLRTVNKLNGSGIIYVRSRKKTIEVANFLIKNGIKTGYYHAGLDSKIRNEQQNLWMQNRNRIIVATNAFGMGIDKPDVRFVVHLDLPDTLEAYFQEAGRAGRDELDSKAVILFENADLINLRLNFENSYPEKDVIKNVYNSLGNYFKIPEGGGKDLGFEFDIRDFCNQYNFTIPIAYNALKFIEKEGYISFIEDPNTTSMLHFIINKEDLYRFQVENPSTDNFIKTILRSYGGVFTDFVKISEKEIAKRTNSDEEKVIKMLDYLSKMQIISYSKATQKPCIYFPVQRLNAADIFLSKENYDFRKRNAETKMKAVIDYVNSKNKCHQQFLLFYFGECNNKRCGKCDFCIERNKMEMNEVEFNFILNQIKPLLKMQYHTIEELVVKTNADEDKVMKVIQWLLDNDKITKVDYMQFFWKSK